MYALQAPALYTTCMHAGCSYLPFRVNNGKLALLARLEQRVGLLQADWLLRSHNFRRHDLHCTGEVAMEFHSTREGITLQ